MQALWWRRFQQILLFLIFSGDTKTIVPLCISYNDHHHCILNVTFDILFIATAWPHCEDKLVKDKTMVVVQTLF